MIKIGIVILVLVAVVLYIRQQKESKTERFRFRMPSFSVSPAGFDRQARKYRDMANREGDANKRNQYNKKAEEYELKARQLREKFKERDANNKIGAALNARQEASADFRSAIDRTPISC